MTGGPATTQPRPGPAAGPARRPGSGPAGGGCARCRGRTRGWSARRHCAGTGAVPPRCRRAVPARAARTRRELAPPTWARLEMAALTTSGRQPRGEGEALDQRALPGLADDRAARRGSRRPAGASSRPPGRVSSLASAAATAGPYGVARSSSALCSEASSTGAKSISSTSAGSRSSVKLAGSRQRADGRPHDPVHHQCRAARSRPAGRPPAPRRSVRSASRTAPQPPVRA